MKGMYKFVQALSTNWNLSTSAPFRSFGSINKGFAAVLTI